MGRKRKEPIFKFESHTTYDKDIIGGELVRRNVITKATWRTVTCKYCGEVDNIFGYGRTKLRKQRFLCKKCGRTFLDNQAPPRMKFTSEAVATALNMFYESASLGKIQRQLQLIYGIRPDRSTIYRWVGKYSKKAAKALSSVPIKAGSIWIADETEVGWN